MKTGCITVHFQHKNHSTLTFPFTYRFVRSTKHEPDPVGRHQQRHRVRLHDSGAVGREARVGRRRLPPSQRDPAEAQGARDRHRRAGRLQQAAARTFGGGEGGGAPAGHHAGAQGGHRVRGAVQDIHAALPEALL